MILDAVTVPGYWGMRYLGFPRLMPMNLTVGVTYRCNSKCATCNIWKKRKVGELSAAEFQKAFASVGSTPYWVTFSGGEPFLREDLEDIVASACTTMRPGIVNIPTNGLAEKTAERVAKIAADNPRTHVIVNLSLDGVGKRHDEIRGVPGAFEKAVKTYRDMQALSPGNLELGIHTVISKYNVNDIPEIFEFAETLKPGAYITEIAEKRAELGTGDDITPSLEDYEKAVGFLKDRMKRKRGARIPRLINALRRQYYDLTVKTLRDRRQAIPCYAGYASAQITPEGDVWPCCVRADVLGNLREADYDFKRIWFGKKAETVRASIRKGECHCPLANASYTNMLANPKALAKLCFDVLR